MDRVRDHALVLWQYLRLDQSLERVDAICALGSDSIRVAEWAADLWHQGYGKYLIVSGGQVSRSLSGLSEGGIYARVARDKGVPSERIIVEDKASNTGENAQFIRELILHQGLPFQSFLLVQKPYMERRVYATFRKQWPEAQFIVTSPRIGYDTYARDDASRDRLVGYLMSTLYRIRTYPSHGFQIPQDIPVEVEASYEALLVLGYGPTEVGRVL